MIGIIRVDGNAIIGMGHVMRCLALSHILKNSMQLVIATRDMPQSVQAQFKQIGAEILDLSHIKNDEEAQFIIKNIKLATHVIFDGYSFNSKYQLEFKFAGKKIILIDDVAENIEVADVIINHSPGANTEMYKKTKAKLCLGLEFAMLQPAFFSKIKISKSENRKKIFLNIGAADPENFTQKILEILIEIPEVEEIAVVVGQVNRHLGSLNQLASLTKKNVKIHFNLSSQEMAELMRSSYIGICSASTVALEASSCALPLLVGWILDNQKTYYLGLIKLGLVLGVDNLKTLTKVNLVEKVKDLMAGTETYIKIRKNQENIIDARSYERLKLAIL